MKADQKKLGVLLAYLAQGIHILSGILYTPIMLRLLGQSEYGLYQLVVSVVSYLNVLSLGFGSSYMRFYSRIKKDGDEEKVASFNGMYLTVFLIIAGICLLCGAVLVENIRLIFGDGLTEQEYPKAQILLALMVFNLALTFVAGAIDSFLTAHEEFIFQRILRVLQYLFNPLITLPLLLMGYGSVAMVLVTTVLTVAKLASSLWYSLKRLRVRIHFGGFQWGLLKEMWIFTAFICLNMIADQINWNVDKVLLGRFSGTVAVAIYGIGGQLNTMYMQLSTTISNVFIPQVNRIVAENNDNRRLTELMTKVGRVQFILMSMVVVGFVFLGRNFIHLWAGDGYEYSFGITLLLIVPETIPLIQGLSLEIMRAKNMHKVRSFVYFAMAVCNVFISIPCITLWGARGAAVGTAVTLILFDCIVMNIYYHRSVGLDMAYYWGQILKFVPAFIPIVLLELLFQRLFPTEGFAALIGQGCAYMAVFAVSMWKLGLNDGEKRLVTAPLQRLGRRLFKKA
ncbi:MAG: oligosaccharide flippase family protein [Eubacteriales bacterium]|nr:oligosaccharide flippase family protein [Eubacteriales bacterium]